MDPPSPCPADFPRLPRDASADAFEPLLPPHSAASTADFSASETTLHTPRSLFTSHSTRDSLADTLVSERYSSPYDQLDAYNKMDPYDFGLGKAQSPGVDTPAPYEEKPPATPVPSSGIEAPIVLSLWRFWAVFGSLCIVVFLFALDQLIVATALPKITAQFDALSQILTLLSFNLLYAQFMNIFPSKHVMVIAIVFFEAGSLVSGIATNIELLIFGRVLSGVGAAGVFGSGMVIIAELTPLSTRGKYLSGFGICFAVACVVGPLLGGTFADHLSWRWCFYINLPLGAVAVILIIIIQPAYPPLGMKHTYTGYSRSMITQVLRCDWAGVCLSTAWGTCLILGAEWGGVSKDWDDWRVITVWGFTAVLTPVFCYYEWYMKDRGYFRIRMFSRRTIGGAGMVGFFIFGCYMILVYYLSLTYQSVYHISATGSGIRLLPLVLSLVLFLILSNLAISKLGRSKAIISIGPVFLIIASACFSTITYETSKMRLYGLQVLLGAGLGCCMQNIMLAVQNELREEPLLVSLGTGMTVFMGFAGRIIGLNTAQSVFENMIQRNLRHEIPGIPYATIQLIMNDAGAVWTDVPDDERPMVLKAYAKTISQVFYITIPMAVFALVGAIWMKDERMVSKEEEEEVEAKAAVGAAGGDVERGQYASVSTKRSEGMGSTEELQPTVTEESVPKIQA
ncbi:hypothetical protein I350_00213 [Cryptococcus amylolentus CBS 6273]|uniref:Major facilitator superfamily (MFS) profile domain-containing protein n=1 Tax=Cryptococcus amylolentus CBS 6273 TaxID=1296118 RepID=A0A1E3KEV3_9TREE|nr:hypothetical protein I350_00213 [Cryptococcus amylolentus CBS 6273]